MSGRQRSTNALDAEQALSTLVSLSGAAPMSIDHVDGGNADGANSDADEAEGDDDGDGGACVVCGSDHSVDDDILVICEGCEMSVHQVTNFKVSCAVVTVGFSFSVTFAHSLGISCASHLPPQTRTFSQSCYGIKDVPVDSWFCEVCMVHVRTLPGVALAADGGVQLPSGMNSHYCDHNRISAVEDTLALMLVVSPISSRTSSFESCF
jgi:hypothetical protein